MKVEHPIFPPKLVDPGEFIISCLLKDSVMYNGLANSGASLNVMPLALYKRSGLPDLAPTTISISLYDQAKKRPVGMAEDVHVRIGDMNFLADFVVMDVEEDTDVPLIFERPFLFTARMLVDDEASKLTLREGDKSVTLMRKKRRNLPTKVMGYLGTVVTVKTNCDPLDTPVEKDKAL
ncbi:uncharacterized protein [Rutidosis leptorrhynchoides]|uniref:uncharacterized protein n=1 Tax=Rutidosis leptorrhynchoides TaxID=125765 RepID=UPI003A993FA8